MSDTRPLPTNWSATTLDDVIACLESGSRPRGGVRGIDSGVPSLGGEHLGELGGFRFDKMRFVPEEFASRQTKGWVKLGDILVVKDGATTGKVSFVGTDFPYTRALLNEHVFRCAVARPIDATFVFYWLYSAEGNRRILLDFRGAAQGGISRGFASKVSLPVAPVPEQHRIVEAIDSYLTRVDDAVASLEHVKTKLKGYHASVLKTAVEGRLVPTEASIARAEKRAFESGEVLLAQILKERRRRWQEAELAKLKAAGKTPKDDRWKAKYEEPAGPNSSELPPLPEGWCWATIGQVYEIKYGLSEPLSRTRPESDQDVPVLRIPNVTPEGNLSLTQLKYFPLAQEKRHKLRLQHGDLLFNWRNSPNQIGRTAVFDVGGEFVNASFLLRLRPPAPSLDGRFSWLHLNHLRRSGYFELRSRAAVNQSNFNASEIAAVPLPLPPLCEQQRIVSQFQQLVSSSEHLGDELPAASRRLVRLRQAVLKWAFEGRLVDQDPADEPADKLLARIRAERAAVDSARKTLNRRTRGAA